MKKSMILSVVCVLALNGCMLTESPDDIDGHLYVKKAFTVMDKDGKTRAIEAKTYDATLHMAAQGADLAIDPGLLKQNIDVLFPDPKAYANGKVDVPASASKQAFDLTGDIEANETRSAENGSDSCVLGFEHYVVCRDYQDQQHHVHRECHDETREILGHQYYSATRVTYTRSANLSLVDPVSKEEIASYSGSYSSSNLVDKVMTSPSYRY
jgi:hypothetical protein